MHILNDDNIIINNIPILTLNMMFTLNMTTLILSSNSGRNLKHNIKCFIGTANIM